MLQATLKRDTTGPAGTFGILTSTVGAAGAHQLRIHIAEPPWLDNAKGKSCIPPGEYRCTWHTSPRFGSVYLLHGTQPRSEVLIHRGNWAGDRDGGLMSDSRGCLLPGVGRGELRGQLAVVGSGQALEQLVTHFDRQDFVLTIEPIQPGLLP